jgi:DNA replication and repair protein RecF
MITDLRLQNFRSYKDGSFEISPGVNIVVGPNASGKTNLLEAVLVLARGSSYRVADNELINFDQPWARLDCHSDNSGQRTVKLFAGSEAKQYEIDGKTHKRLTLSHSLPVVLFEPGHLRLLTGSPERRRDYLDDLLEQTIAGYGTTRRHYKRALAQRNRLLKIPDFQNQLFPWNIRLSQLAGQIVRARTDLAGQINKEITDLYKELSGSKTMVSARYDSRWPAGNYESQLLKKLETSIEEDQLRGFTSSGPHREDLIVLFDDHPASEVASRGEVRTAVLALKIIELKIIEGSRNKTPLLLLDDVFSELDGRRRHALVDYLSPYQTFITTTDADLITKHFTQKAHTIPISKE